MTNNTITKQLLDYAQNDCPRAYESFKVHAKNKLGEDYEIRLSDLTDYFDSVKIYVFTRPFVGSFNAQIHYDINTFVYAHFEHENTKKPQWINETLTKRDYREKRFLEREKAMIEGLKQAFRMLDFTVH